MRDRKTPAVANSHEPEPEAEDRACGRHRGRREPQCGADHDHGGAGQGGDGVKIGAQTVGTSVRSTSRVMPPPMPVSMPRSAAITGLSPKASAFWAPATAKSASPAASNRSTGVLSRSTYGGPPEGKKSGEQRNRQIAPVADCRGRRRADQQVAGNASGIARRKRQDQNSEQIEPVRDPRHRAADREYKSADEIKHQQQRCRPGLSHSKPRKTLWRQPSPRRDD